MLTKPCGRGGCTGTVTKARPSDLASTTFCGKRCAYLDRLRGGWEPCKPLRGRKRPAHVMEAVMAGRRHAYRVRRAIKAAELFERVVPEDVRQALQGRRELAAVRLAVIQAVEYGHRLGRLARAKAARVDARMQAKGQAA